jgi:hypothetical protein
MPCTISREEELWYEEEGNYKRTGRRESNLALTTAVACAVCKILDGYKNGGVERNAPKWVRAWWKEHQRQDRERISEAKDHNVRKALKK